MSTAGPIAVAVVVSSFLLIGRPAEARGDLSGGEGSALSAPASVEKERSANELKLTVDVGIRLYQILLSSQDSQRCGFEPSCSRFGREAISRFGIRGVLMASDRLLRCNAGGLREYYELNPVTGKAVDPVERRVLSDRGGAATGKTDGITLVAKSAHAETFSLGGGGGDLVDVAQSDDRTRAFADHLSRKGDYIRAAAEYERYIFLSRVGGSHADSIRFTIGICLRRGGEPSAARPYFESVFESDESNGLECAAFRQLLYTDWDQGEYADAVGRATAIGRGPGNGTAACETGVALSMSHLLSADYAAARSALEAVPGEEARKLGSLVADMEAVIEAGTRFDPKSPLKASVLSALVPGLGRVRMGRTWDGLVSLATVSLTAWASWEGFSDGGLDSAQGWVFGTAALGFYAGNIYGTAVSARSSNRSVELRIHSTARKLATEMSFRI